MVRLSLCKITALTTTTPLGPLPPLRRKIIDNKIETTPHVPNFDVLPSSGKNSRVEHIWKIDELGFHTLQVLRQSMSMRNGLLSEEGAVKFAWLQKDKKQICRTKYANFPFKVTDCWGIHDFKPSSKYKELNLPQFQLFPAPLSSHEKTEWTNFMNYLSNRSKVAIVRMKSCTFYLLAPDECQKLTHVNVLYKLEKPLRVVEMSGENFNKAKNSQDDSKLSFINVGRDFTTDDGSPASLRSESGHERTAKIHPSYLKTLSQTHVWPFGALAELIDNSRDAGAPRLAISVEHLYSRRVGEMIPVLSVVDDGTGMSHDDIARMLTFGHKSNNENKDKIGCFGIGFKTGTMKLGKDVLILTQTLGSRSVALLSQSYNEHKVSVEIPIITYRKIGTFMEIDLNIHSEKLAITNLDAVKEFSPFNEYLLGERLGLFGEMGTGTQIYIWNLDKWGSDYSLEWVHGKNVVEGSFHHYYGDILIRSRKLRSRAGQISQHVPLDYSLQAYLEVIFLDSRMEMIVQGSMVKSRPLMESLNKTSVVKGTIMGKEILLTLGRSQLEWERMNGGIFLYWRGRLIEAYKRVGGMIHNADIGRGVIGVVDVSNLMDDVNGHVLVLNNKQGFQDCELYAKLEEWLGNKLDEYWSKCFDRFELNKGIKRHKPIYEWVQCGKCQKWRMLDTSSSSGCLPPEWFCYMPPFNGKCETAEEHVTWGKTTIGAKRPHVNAQLTQTKEELVSTSTKKSDCEHDQLTEPIIISPIKKGIAHDTSSRSSLVCKLTSEDDTEENTSKLEYRNPPFELTWARKGRRGY